MTEVWVDDGPIDLVTKVTAGSMVRNGTPCSVTLAAEIAGLTIKWSSPLEAGDSLDLPTITRVHELLPAEAAAQYRAILFRAADILKKMGDERVFWAQQMNSVPSCGD